MNDLSRDVKGGGTVILVADDADYVPVIARVKPRGWKVEVWYWSNAADKLRSAGHAYHNLDTAVYTIGFREGDPKAKK